MDLGFLAPLIGRPGPWATVCLDTSRTTEDAQQRQVLLQRTAVRELADRGADPHSCRAVAEHLAGEPASGSPPGRALFAAGGEVVLDVPLTGAPPVVETAWGPLPHLAPLLGRLEAADADCLVAAIDRTGADLEMRRLGRAEPLGTVDGATWQGRGHRAPPTDRYEWHYRHREQDAWDRSADTIAGHLVEARSDCNAHLVVLTGDARERRAVHERLPKHLQPLTVEVDGGGRAGGIHTETFERRLDEAWQEFCRHHADEILERFRNGTGRPGERRTDGTGTEIAAGAAAEGVPAVTAAARQHQLATLLLGQDGPDTGREVWIGPEPEHIGTDRGAVRSMGVPRPERAQAGDALLRCAIASHAEAITVPDGAGGPVGGVGAVLRWRS
ncbi:hypothetical protein [Kitasatospora sp. DSM 101779]|uniref:baeRF2 domain-containing protein n=1 Tax=Kitasatospora sp. DSM 101779 TaxID=2853165 RepID=UPI0021D7F2E7|nr:hypothetical protein [Kitasatospora sp. DSM 101779]MCU7826851.1 hypothetical protein [Kitasatospora sp. DSM 101779]